MIKYYFFVSGEEMITKDIDDFGLMRLCPGGGVEAFPSGDYVCFFDKNEAIKAKERLEAKGIEVGSDVFEADDPNIIEIEEDEDDNQN